MNRTLIRLRRVVASFALTTTGFALAATEGATNSFFGTGAGNGASTTIRFANPEYGVAPGQAAVIYAGDRVVGGGWIDGTDPAA